MASIAPYWALTGCLLLSACSLRAPPLPATSASPNSPLASNSPAPETLVSTPDCTATISTTDSLQEQVNNAKEHAVLCLAAGVHHSEIEITRSITLRALAADPRATTLKSGGEYAVIWVRALNATVVLEGLTLVGGGEDSGGGLFLDTYADVTLRRCIISSNNSYIVGGGGIYMESGTLLLEDCILEGNQSEEDGGAILMNNDAELTMRGGRIVGNRARSGAALAMRGGTALLDGVTIEGNQATNQQDPNLYLRGGSRKPIHLTLRGCTMDEVERASLKQRFPDHVSIEP